MKNNELQIVEALTPQIRDTLSPEFSNQRFIDEQMRQVRP